MGFIYFSSIFLCCIYVATLLDTTYLSVVDYTVLYIVVVNACIKPAPQLSLYITIALTTPSCGSDRMLDQQTASQRGFCVENFS